MRLPAFWFPSRKLASTWLLLAKVIEQLDVLSGATERDFLHLGNRLQDIVARAQQESAKLTSLLEAVTPANSKSLAATLDELTRWAARTGAGVEASSQLRDLLGIVRAVSDPVRQLQNAVRALQVMGVITRMEAARLGSEASGFEALASEVAALAATIEQKADAVQQAVRSVAELLYRTRRTLADTQRTQHAEIGAMSAAGTACLRELDREQERFDAVSRQAAERYRTFSAGVSNLVAALQSHDSTRQRIEHIVGSLRDANQPSAGHECATVIELQAAQLSETRDASLQAACEIRSDLDGLGQTIADCTSMAQNLLGVSQGSEENIFADLEHRFIAIAETVSRLADSRATVARETHNVRQACEHMTSFVAEIETVGGRLLRLALNAEIQAVQLHETGVVMEAVAGGIRQAAEEASSCARAAGTALQQVSRAAEFAPAGHAEIEPGDTAAQATALGDRIHRLTQELKAAAHGSTATLESLAAGSLALTAEIDCLRQSISADQMVDAVCSSCLTSLQQIAAALASARPKRAPSRAVGHAGANYTMHAERDVHQAFIGAATPAACAAPEASEFGENVELF